MGNKKTFTLPDKIIRFLESLPKDEQSEYVSDVLLKAIEEEVQRTHLRL